MKGVNCKEILEKNTFWSTGCGGAEIGGVFTALRLTPMEEPKRKVICGNSIHSKAQAAVG